MWLLLLLMFAVSCAAKPVSVRLTKPFPSADAYYFYLLGYSAEKEGKWEDAIGYYDKALKLDLSSSYLRIQISYVLLRAGKVSEAMSLAEEVVKKEPDYIPALMLLGELYNSQKRSEESIKMYERVLKIKPDQREAALFLGLLYASVKEYDKAIDILEKLERVQSR